MNVPCSSHDVLIINQHKALSISNDDLVGGGAVFEGRFYLCASDLFGFIVKIRNYFLENAVYDGVRIYCGHCLRSAYRPLVNLLPGSAGVWKWNFAQIASKFRSLITKSSEISGPSKSTFIFVVNALKISGGGFEVYRLASELRDAGEDVLIVVMWRAQNEMENSHQIPIMRLTNWKTQVVWAVFQLPIIFIRFWMQTCQPRMIKARPIWIFTHYSTLPLAMLVSKLNRWTFVQDLEWRFIGEGVSAQLLKKFILLIYRRSHLLAANAGLEAALQRCDLKVDAVAPIWADQTFMQVGNDKRDVDILMVLRKGSHKRLDLYLAFISSLAGDVNVRMVVITTEHKIAEQVRPLVSECHVNINKMEMAALYARTKIFLLLSEHEGFGLPPLEAMGAGCVPVCRDSGGPQSYMQGILRDLLLPLTLPLTEVCITVTKLLGDSIKFQQYSEATRRIFQEGVAISDQRVNKIRSLMSKY
ncbi:MAG: glycosyltransferase involved in cell wall biosynthesis [Porticoccaceae bacterium]|jgi:glycosyltransferase involved in cell wall biosynthesis